MIPNEGLWRKLHREAEQRELQGIVDALLDRRQFAYANINEILAAWFIIDGKVYFRSRGVVEMVELPDITPDVILGLAAEGVVMEVPYEGEGT